MQVPFTFLVRASGTCNIGWLRSAAFKLVYYFVNFSVSTVQIVLIIGCSGVMYIDLSLISSFVISYRFPLMNTLAVFRTYVLHGILTGCSIWYTFVKDPFFHLYQDCGWNFSSLCVWGISADDHSLFCLIN